jgi:hypothetical protein
MISEVVNTLELIGSENTAVKFIGNELTGSACVEAWLIVKVGEVESLRVTLLSTLVLAVLPLLAGSVILLIPMEGISVPFPDAITDSVKVILSPELAIFHVIKLAVPF